MKTITIMPDELAALVDRIVDGPAPNPITATQAAVIAAIRAARHEGEFEMATALALLNSARILSPRDMHEALQVLFQRHVDAMERRGTI